MVRRPGSGRVCAGDCARRRSPFSNLAAEKKTSSAKKDQKKLNSLVLRTRKFAQQHKLNIYTKAKLLNTIKWEMRDAGHDEAVVDEVVTLIAPLLS
ncbi:MAG: hypothetical protein GZ089_07800 [Aromatoleum sp.]|nr:hypothetical protein [Aromatoleum sp.]